MEKLLILNNYTNDILLNLVFGWVFYAIYKKRRIKLGKTETAIAAFYLVLLVDNWFNHFTSIEDLWYYIATAIVFIPFSVFPTAKLHLQLAIFIAFASLLYLFGSEQLIQFCYFVTIVILLVYAKKHLLQSARNRNLGIVLILIAVYYFFIVQPYTLSKIGNNWAQSKYLIYFSICDYTVFTTMLIVIHANFRRLFFN